jgi:two-component system chemotaxis sensor kinase CheA
MPTDGHLLQRLLATFRVEAQEHIQTIASELVELEKASTEEAKSSSLDAAFRSAHSLKGAARTVNVTDMETLCQSLESVFAAMKRGEIDRRPELFDLLLKVADTLGKLLQFVASEPTASPKPRVGDLVHSLQAALKSGPPAKPEEQTEQPAELFSPSPAMVARGVAETVRVSTTRLDAVLLQTEELLSAKLAAAQHASKLRHIKAQPADWKKKWAMLRPGLRSLLQALDKSKDRNGSLPLGPLLTRFAEFLEWNQGFIESMATELSDLATMMDNDQRVMGAMVDNLLDEIKKVVLQPFSTLLDVFPRFVRELSREQSKDVDLAIHGGEIEIDRRILEEMKDPLIHLTRNCLDHGIEAPAERVSRGKPTRGTITLSISPKSGGHVELLVADDGAGIDRGKVSSAAVRQGVLSAENAEGLDAKELASLIFESGVSTSPMVTNLSGRGLGLAIVKERVERLNGALSLETEPGKGTTFRIILPLTVARFRGVMVRVGEHLYVVPTSNVERVVRVGKDRIRTVENREAITIDGEAMSLARLRDVLGVPSPVLTDAPPEVLSAVVLMSIHHRIAFVVDEVLQEQEVLVKTLGKQLTRVRNISSATVLGSGKVVPILNVPDLMKSAVKASATGVRTSVVSKESAPAKKSILVAEDSITSRTLLKNILEIEGYEVTTAVDGTDAFNKLHTGKFDLVISDVDMPRMNGFGLTAKIRADKKFTELPVLLVTALESGEDRERGMDAGANAYIVKSSFDQSSLLEVMRRLI